MVPEVRTVRCDVAGFGPESLTQEREAGPRWVTLFKISGFVRGLELSEKQPTCREEPQSHPTLLLGSKLMDPGISEEGSA